MGSQKTKEALDHLLNPACVSCLGRQAYDAAVAAGRREISGDWDPSIYLLEKTASSTVESAYGSTRECDPSSVAGCMLLKASLEVTRGMGS